MSPSVAPHPQSAPPEASPLASANHAAEPEFVGPRELFHSIQSWLSVASRCPHLDLPAPRFLVTGPSGCGKATLFRAAAAEHGVPVIELDPFDYLQTHGGLTPKRMEDAISDFCAQAGRIEQGRWLGIILLRGMDRIARAGELGSLMQANLASLVRKRSLQIHSQGRMIEVNPSSQITFVISTSLPDSAPQRALGFVHEQALPSPDQDMAAPADPALRTYGFNPVLLDAFKFRIHLPRLATDDLIEVMQGPEFSGRMRRFSEGGLRMRVAFSDCALREIAQKAFAMGRNAHSLETVAYEALHHIARERDRLMPGEDVCIRVDSATVNGGPLTEISPCELPPAPGGEAKKKDKAASDAHSVRRPGRGHGSPADVRMATAADLARWIPNPPKNTNHTPQ